MYTILLLACAVGSSSAFLESFFESYSNCSYDQFTCRNSRCVPLSKRCDNNNDCLDFSDEDDCDAYLCKEPKYFKCSNDRCISKLFVCDGENDCEDFTDEKDCENFKLTLQTNSSCGDGHWQCKDKLCIPNEWVCNGESDCLDGSDETLGCSAHINCDGFKCNNGHCIPNEWVCDQHDDCNDNSDEVDCDNHIDLTKCTMDNQKFLCSNNKTCVDLKLVCNGKNNCPDNSDEGPLCSQPSMSCSHHGCTHDCVQLPTGPACLCPKGYHKLDEKHCQNINECEIYGICDQKCRNTEGSYECYCEEKYNLQADKRTCKARGGEAMMVFSSKTEIRAYTLTSGLYFPVAKQLRQVVGVYYDGHHVYWTDISNEHESIVRSIEDGSEKELLVTAGLSLPEDLAVDHVTGNIYFTDAEKQHIGVCSNDGTHCTVLVNKGIRKPRGICLNSEAGEMYWTDWGKPAEIACSYMDGTYDRGFVSSNIHWPNGLCLDGPNERLYWTDARKLTVESIRLDGTGRQIILEGVVKHPYAIAVFEDKLYWSDWATHSIQSCEKFTGKNHTTIVKENKEFIYGISIYHSSLHVRTDDPCSLSFCSDICLLSGASYTCACPQNKVLSSDKHTCKEVDKKQMLILGARNMLVEIEHQILGRHEVTALPTIVKKVGALAYNSINNTLYVSDLEARKIISVDLHTGQSSYLIVENLGKVICMDYDHFGNNLYLCIEDRSSVEILNLHTMARTVILHDLNGEIPEAIALIPEEGVMFLSLKKKDYRQSHIERLLMDGSGRTHAIETGLIGPISLIFDYDLYRVFWADAGTGNIETTSIDGDDRHSFRYLSTSPIGLAILDLDVFWVNQFSKRVYWAQKNATTLLNKKITVDIPEDIERMYLVSITPKKVSHHTCQVNNGNCSHICLVNHAGAVCACPIGMFLDVNSRSCTKRAHCESNEFNCHVSNTCLLRNVRCNGHRDCPNGEDEQDCEKPNHCPLGHFQCHDGDCINEQQVCDYHYDCKDKSDEQDCQNHPKHKGCPNKEYMCGDGTCISERFICDGTKDCLDGSDELYCPSATCEVTQFRCNSGTCIPKSWECDNDFDCTDLSDEHSQCQSITCSPDMFTCSNGKCVDKHLVCDRTDDCGDNSDENSCNFKSSNGCGIDEFACLSNTSICVLNSARCNGTSECPHHEDEKDCSDCNVDEFSCKNKKCIPAQWLCDHVNDCGDNSDELEDFCEHKPGDVASVTSTSCQHGFRCKSGTCIEKKLLCNGKHDCYDGSDEDGLCTKACEGINNPCSQECIKTPVGPECKCRKGFTLMGDGHSCADINECEMDPPVCSQICHNKQGNFTCDCYEGFLPRSDKKSCKAAGEPMSLVYTSDNQVRELTQRTKSLNVLYSDETPKVTGVDVDVDNNYVYFSIENVGTIHRINTANMKREYIEHVGQPQKVAVDWSTLNVYYVNAESNSKSISICNFDDKVCTKLISIDLHKSVSALAVDSLNKVVFYSLTSWWVFNSPSYVIYKSNLDGTGSHELVVSSVGYITGLTFDLNKKVLYFVDQHNNEIGAITYSGKNKTTLFANISRPISLRFFEDHLYYSGVGGYMTKCTLYGKRACDSFKLHSYASELFVINQKSLQPDVKNPCKNHNCSYLCVPNSVSYKCLCEGGILIENSEKCAHQKYDVSSRRLFPVHSVQMQEDGKTKSSTSAVLAAIFVPLAFIVFGAVFYVILRRRNSGNFNISMRFYNPGYGRQPDELDKPILQPGQHEYENPNYREACQEEHITRRIDVD